MTPKESLLNFADQVNELTPVLMREFARRQANELCKGKITFPQFLILDFLSRESESTMTDISRFMRVTTATMTGIVNRLVEAGYCQRIFNPQDRRIVMIKLTSRGDNIVRKINEQRRRMIVDIFGKLSLKERDDYLRILTRIREMIIAKN